MPLTTGLNGVWTKVSALVPITVASVVDATVYMSCTAASPNVYFVDDVSVWDVTEANVADTKAVAAQATANTGVTNAATADGKAVTAQNAADAADAKAVAARALLDAATSSGVNLIPDPSFENPALDSARATCWGGNYSHSTEQKKSGTRSIKLIYPGGANYGSMNFTPSLSPVNSTTRANYIPTTAGRTYYVSQWVYLASPNTGSREVHLYCMTWNDTFTAPGYVLVQAFPPLDTWVKMEAYLTIDDADAAWMVPLFGAMRPGNPADAVMYVDDLVLIDVTDAYNAQIDADAAAAQANTATTNAATADAKAVTADGKAVAAQTDADAADTKAVAAQGFAATALKSGGNILPNGGFENTSFYTANGTYETAVKRSGAYSCSLTGSGVRINLTTGFTTNDTIINSLPCRPSSTFYVEGWVYGDPANTGGGSIQIYVDDYNSAGVLQPQQYRTFSATTALRGVWTKISGKITVSASAASVYIFIYQSGQPGADKYYYDNFVAYEVTEADAAQVDADAAANTASTALTNASTADGKAVTADGKAVAINQAIYGQATPGSTIAQTKVASLTTDLSTISTAATNAANAATTADGKAVAINQAIYGQATPGSTIAQTKVASLTTDLAAKLTSSSALNASNLSSGTLPVARVTDYSLPQTKVTSLNSDLSTISTAATNAANAATTADGKAVAINQAIYGQATPGSTIAQTKVASLTTDLAAKLTSSSALNASNLSSGTLPVDRVTDGSLPQAKVSGLPTKITALETEDAATNNAIYNAYFGSGGSGTAANVTTAIADIKAKIAGGWTVQSITTTSTWTRPWTTGAEPAEFWCIAVGSGSGGGRGRSGLSGAAGGIGGIGGRWLAKVIDPADIPATVSVTIGAGGAGVNSGTGNASPNNLQDTSFGTLCATNSTVTASIADFIGYYSCDDSRPGTGGDGGANAVGSASPGTAGEGTPMAAGGAAGVWGVNSNAGSVGGTAVLTGSTRAGGGGGGGGYGGTGAVGPGVGGAGGWPGGGGAGGGGNFNIGTAAGGNGGNGGNGAVILIWR